MAKKKPPTEEGELPASPPFDIEEFRVQKAQTIWSYDDLGFDLTVEEGLFVRSYMIDRNPVAALRRLNYDYEVPRLKKMAAQMLARPDVQAAVDAMAKRIMEALEVTAIKVQESIAQVAFFDPRQVLTFDENGVSILHSRFWTEAQARNIQSVKMGKEGLEIKFYDSLRAREMLAKQTGVQPDETAETAAIAAKAGAEAVFDKILDIFNKTVDPDNEISLPTLDEARRLN